jgi:hypothetical protein
MRLPPDVKRWLEREADRNAGSQNNEIVRSLRARMVAAGQQAGQGRRCCRGMHMTRADYLRSQELHRQEQEAAVLGASGSK